MFLRLSGADPDIIKVCPKFERTKYVGFGMLVLIPAILASVSMSYAISTITPNPYVYVFLGLVWGGVILIIDRFVVTTLYKSKFDKKSSFYFAAIGRMVFSIILGLTISHPFVLLWFDASIEERIQDNSRQKYENSYSKQRLDRLEAEKKCVQDLLTNERAGVESHSSCGSSSGKYGDAGVAAGLVARIGNIDTAINIAEQNFKEEKSEILSFKSTDYLTKVKALDEISTFHTWIVQIFIILFFLCIDVLAVLFKIISPYGIYEAHRDKIIELAYADIEFDIDLHKKELEHKKTIAHNLLEGNILKNKFEQLCDIYIVFIEKISEIRTQFNSHISQAYLDLGKIVNEDLQKKNIGYISTFMDSFFEQMEKLNDYFSEISNKITKK